MIVSVVEDVPFAASAAAAAQRSKLLAQVDEWEALSSVCPVGEGPC